MTKDEIPEGFRQQMTALLAQQPLTAFTCGRIASLATAAAQALDALDRAGTPRRCGLCGTAFECVEEADLCEKCGADPPEEGA